MEIGHKHIYKFHMQIILNIMVENFEVMCDDFNVGKTYV
jgi:hypothetical protein